MDPVQCRATEGDANLFPQQCTRCSEAEAADTQLVDWNRRAVQRERQRLVLTFRATGEEQADLELAEPSERELERIPGVRVEPLHIVDGQHERHAGGQHAQRAHHCDRDGATIGWSALGLGQQKRNFKRAPLRMRQPLENAADHAAQKVPEGCERKPRLAFGRAGGEKAMAPRLRLAHRFAPDRGLPDSRLALDQQRGRKRLLEEAPQRGKFPIPADDLVHRGNPRS